MNKNGKTSTLITLGAVALIGILAFLVYNSVTTPQTGFGTQTGAGPQASAGGNYIVTTGATFTATGRDKQSSGTAVPGTQQVSVANANTPTQFGGFSTAAASSYSPGQVLNFIFVNNTAYHNAYVAGHIVPAATSDVITVDLNKNASVTEVWAYPYSGLNIVNGGGANNITNAGTAGASYTIQDTMYGTALQSTQDLLCVIELTVGVNATSSPAGITYTGAGVSPNAKYGTSAPAWYSTVGANSRVWTFDQAPLASAAGVTNTITATALSTKTIPAGSRLIKTCYTKEWFVDANTGLATYDVADSNNAMKNIASYTFTGYFE